MERYFLSYVVIDAHSLLCLSHQPESQSDAKIIAEIGFSPSSEYEIEDNSLLRNMNGHVTLEGHLSYSLYSTLPVLHRTYELSASQTEEFFKKVNSDRQINIQTLKRDQKGYFHKYSKGNENLKIEKGRKDNLDLVSTSGPTYNMVRYNCKNYCLDVLKATGVVDAEGLSNYFVQQPKKDSPLLLPVNSSVLACPEKDTAMTLLSDFSDKLDEILPILQKNKKSLELRATKQEIASFAERFGAQPEEITNENYFSGIADLLKNLRILKQIKSKMGITKRFDRILLETDDLITVFLALSPHLSLRTNIDPMKEGVSKFLTELKQVLSTWSATHRKIKVVVEKEESTTLQYQWKGSPQTVSQVSVANLSDSERVLLSSRQKINEAIDGCTVIGSALFDSAKTAENHGNENLIGLLNELNTHNVQPCKTKLIEARESFESKLKELNFRAHSEQQKGGDCFTQENHDRRILECCLHQNEHVKKILGSLEEKVKTFKPDAPHEKIGPIKRFIQAVLSLIRKPTYGLTDDPQNLLAKSISKLNRSVLASGSKISPIQKNKIKGGFFSRKRKSTSKKPKNKRPE